MGKGNTALKKGIGKRIKSFIMAAAVAFSALGPVSSTAEARSVSGETIRFNDSRTITDYKYSDISYNYAKLLQYSLYLYDANMCGTNVGNRSLLSWRGNCHTYDKAKYTLKSGKTIDVDVTGGFHDAGDHVKFGITEAYSAMVLEMSYYTDKAAYEAAGQTGHMKTIADHYAEYLKKCMVLNDDGRIEAFVVQVGEGNDDHNTYWGAPEKQPQSSGRKIYFADAKGNYSTDIVALSAAALALHYLNYKDTSSLTAARKLFTFAKNNPKAVNTTAGSFYASSGWEDDYCLAAAILYQITGTESYNTEYNKYCNTTKGNNIYWALSWDNTAPVIAYFKNDAGKLKSSADVAGSHISNEGYVCLLDWGSARYNTALQYVGLLYDKVSKTSTYRNTEEAQMKFLLGNNSQKQCFVVGYNAYSPQYPHHEAASGYGFSELDQGTYPMKYSLIGALVGGPKSDGTYADTADDYIYNEVAIDYNATLVASAAAIYSGHIGESGQTVDSKYYKDNSDPEPEKLYDVRKMTYKGVTGWYYAPEGKVIPTFNGFASNKSGWWYLENGKVSFKVTDVIHGKVKGKTGWWYVKDSKVQFVDTVAKNSKGWWYIKKGMIDLTYTGLAKNENGWWRIVKGKVNFKCRGLVKHGDDWWYVRDGKVDFTFEGISSNSYGKWYCKGGKVQFGFSGKVKFNGKTYTIKDGKVV